MQMAPNYVGRRKRLPGSSAEQESNLAAANELMRIRVVGMSGFVPPTSSAETRF